MSFRPGHEKARGRGAFALASLAAVLGVLFWLVESPPNRGTAHEGQGTHAPPSARRSDAPRMASHRPLPALPGRAPAAGAAAFTGLVQDGVGRAIAGATLCQQRDSQECCSTEACWQTDAEGRFELDVATGDRFSLVVSAPSFQTLLSPMFSGASNADTVLVLQRGGAPVEGKVVDLTGGAIAGAMVRANGGDGPASVALSGEDGRFVLSVSERSVTLVGAAAGYSDTEQQHSAPVRDVVLGLVPSSSISGVVIDDRGAPLTGVSVRAENIGGLRARPALARTDEDGRFEISLIPAGNYEVRAGSRHWSTEKLWVSVPVGASPDPVRLTAFPSTFVSGRVNVAGAPCRSGYLELTGADTRREWLAGDGSVYSEGLRPGSYLAAASCMSPLGVTGVDEVTLTSEGLSRTWDLDEQALGGQVEAEEPAAQRGSLLVAVSGLSSERDAANVVLNGSGGLVQHRHPEGGEALFADLEEGAYAVTVDVAPEARQLVRVSPNAVMRVALDVPATSDISGTVVDQEGVPVVDAWVRLRDPALPPEESRVPPALTNEDGAFGFSGRFVGRYSIDVEAPTSRGRLNGVAPGARGVVIRVMGEATLSGLVEDVRGEEMSFSVDVRRAAQREGHSIDGVGSWRLEHLEPGTYEVAVQSARGCSMQTVEVAPHRETRVISVLDPRSSRCE